MDTNYTPLYGIAHPLNDGERRILWNITSLNTSNELFINDLANRAQYVSEMVKKIGDIPFVWISPSDWNGDTGINDIIKERVGAGHFFDSRHLKLKRGSDHYHPTWEAAAYWMDTAAKFIASNECDNPLQLKSPKAHHKATNTSLLQPAFEGF